MNQNNTAADSAPRDRKYHLDRLARDPHVVEPGQEYVIDVFRPEDAVAVSRCVYDVYGDSHPFDYVYDPEALTRRFTSGEHYTAVARTVGGDILGMFALYRSAPFAKMLEFGQMMIMRSCRDATLGLKLCAFAVSKLADLAQAEVLFGETVCTHVFTQYAARKNKFVECGLELEALPASAFAPGEGMKDGRASLLLYVKMLMDSPHTVFMPESALELAEKLYGRLGLQREVQREGREPAPASELERMIFAEAGLARFNVTAAGKDIGEQAASAEAELKQGAVQVFLNLGDPATPAAAEILRARGYFLGGVLPRWFGTDALLLQRLSSPPELETLKIGSRDGKETLRLVQEDMERVAAGTASKPGWGH